MIVVIASLIMLSYADWDVRKKPNGLQNVTNAKWNTGSQRVNPTCLVFLVENQARIEGIYKYFCLSTPDYLLAIRA